eukprot:24378_1
MGVSSSSDKDDNLINTTDGWTVACDTNGNNCTVGEFKPSKHSTAHSKLVYKCKTKSKKNYIGGSVKNNGSVGYNSSTLNTQHFGTRTAYGYPARNMKKNLTYGNYNY